ncbi:uncharacterized protein EDB91DRAFT_1088726 [Suillus paluster]|uniref:uncharacterized protein n=1 Tax=Suillus paluster TaxID=48578 RepID=UPI001B869A6B|nr:uncharacterized protein EDB91DRAFT_1088726 [Suillus paluster]KAG1720728.1 hypothetical protein EDB91DRAFT_1088726 [Suillus paluster]
MSLEAGMAIVSLQEFGGLLVTKDFGFRRLISSLHMLATMLLPDPALIIMLNRLAYSEALNQLQAGNNLEPFLHGPRSLRSESKNAGAVHSEQESFERYILMIGERQLRKRGLAAWMAQNVTLFGDGYHPICDAHFGHKSSGWCMTVISNDPSWWPVMNSGLISSYFTVAASTGVMYDCVLTFGQEVELIWVRYLGILFAVTSMLAQVPTIPMTDAGCFSIFVTTEWTNVVAPAMLVIMMAWLYAMYQRSRTVLILLIIVLLAVTITNGAMNEITNRYASGGGIIGDCFTVLMRTQVVYFASFAAASSFNLVLMLPKITVDPYSLQNQILAGVA